MSRTCLCIPLSLTLLKASDLDSRKGLFAILLKIGYVRNLFNIVKSLHISTRTTVQYDGSVSDSFETKSGVRQDCVLTPILFGLLR